MFCPHCGNEVKKLSGYCDHCGRDLGAVPMAGRRLVWPWVLLSVVVIILAMIGSCGYVATNAVDNLEETFGSLQDQFDEEGRLVEGMGDLMLDRLKPEARKFMNALQRKEFEAALDHMHPEAQDLPDAQQLGQTLEEAGIADFTNYEIEEFGYSTKTLPYLVVVMEAKDGTEGVMYLDMMLHEGTWMIDNLQLD